MNTASKDDSDDHGITTAPERSLRIALVLTGTFLIAEVIGGIVTNSLALLSDAAHMFTDVAALAIALLAIRIGKRAADRRRTFGYARFEILAAAFNAVLLFLVALYILWEAVDRFRTPAPVQSTAMMVIAALGLIVNLISMRLLQAGSEKSLNVKGAYLEVWSDMLGSVGVLVAGAVIQFTGWTLIDPIIAVLIGFWVLPRTWVLLKDSLNVLLEGVPSGMALENIEAEVRTIPGVVAVHDLHVWAVSSGKALLTAHVVRDGTTEIADSALLATVRARLKGRFDVHHATLELERAAPGDTTTEETFDHA
ncbi:cobalt-zinc-cadmium efflux system protein [Tahibacter aquaticus]|uniref:Cobalt-zinc-cadmium efflux system protein n=1 Tax=Tahibacter aquaticus TaxID=520092 RepID=A0A4R6Z1X3_9GAMM|nr:cation diffusion facilitator family transporter [Tahibacter aquaticus]TDR45588.1 cobalt-zinc-cadmium efflux system protein [Tahibacter aquaticus]